jgi:hypothetical protein
MKNQNWYEKASVQSAIVNGIPAIFTAIIAVIAIATTYNNSNKQLNLIEKQYYRDSINSALQMQLILEQINITSKGFIIDSFTSVQQLQIAKTQLKQIIAQEKTQSTTNRIKFSATVLNILELWPGTIEDLNKLTLNERIKLVDTVDFLLNKERFNPLLVNNKQCLEIWNGTIFNFKMLKNKRYQQFMLSDEFFAEAILSYWQSIMIVYNNLIIQSK